MASRQAERRCYFFNSFFFKKLIDGEREEYKESTRARVTRNKGVSVGLGF